jgi:hypothetical protein
VSFVLKQKAPKVQERTMLPPHRAKHLARRSFIPPRGYCSSLIINFHLSKLDRVLRLTLEGVMNVHPQTAAYRVMIFAIRMLFELAPCPMPRKTVKYNFYSPPRLHRPLITVPPALTGAAITALAFAEPFIAAGAAVAFIRCSLLFFKGPHGLVVPPRLALFCYRKRTKPPRL